ncbi:MAG TPA: hypothetical protein VGN09_07595 [Vicinamibacteria bacterium]|jgi:hypothetical protein
MSRKKARVLTVVLLGIALLGVAQPSHAQTFLGTFCWKLDPFVDTLRIPITSYPGGIFETLVRWRAGTSYQFQGAGVLSPDTSSTGLLLAFSSAGTTPNFACDFQGHMTSGLNGTWEFKCNSTGFTNSGTLTFLSTCPAGSAPEASEGRTAMDAK